MDARLPKDEADWSLGGRVQRLRVRDREGREHTLELARFGRAGARPKVYMQAGLHADELPGILTLRHLAAALAEADARGRICGEIVLVPAANPIGLSQIMGEWIVGRAEFGGRNFNRGFSDLAEGLPQALAGKLGDDAQANVAAIRAAMGKALGGRYIAGGGIAALHLRLLRLAHDCDIALDLHADNEAQLHLYTTEAAWPRARDLAAELDARAILLCDDSGPDLPFDEALSRPWLKLAKAFPEAAIPLGCFSATLELRSNNEVDDDLADRDARALLRFLVREGVIEGEIGALPRLLCEATPLEGVQQLKAPIAGLILYHRRLGDSIRAGELVAEIAPPFGAPAPVYAQTDGVLFARHNQPYAWPGKTIGKIAGATPLAARAGALLAP